jgi:hypothetical protein
MALLASAGDSAAALGAYADFSRRLRREYDAEPNPESLALARALKLGQLVPERPRIVAERAPDANPSPPPGPPQGRGIATRSRVARIALTGVALAAGLVLAEPLVRDPVTRAAGRVVLADFTNHTHDSLLGVAVTRAVRAELSKIAHVDLARARAVQPAVTAGPLAPGQVLILVTGDVTPLGSGFAVSAKLVAAGSGRLLGVIQEEAADTSALLPTVRRLSQRLQGNLRQSRLTSDETGGLDLGASRREHKPPQRESP